VVGVTEDTTQPRDGEGFAEASSASRPTTASRSELDEALQAAARGDLQSLVNAWMSNGAVHGGLIERLYGQLAAEVVREYLREERAAVETAKARGPRVKQTALEYSQVEPPPTVMNDVLAAEVNLLGGPTEAGKSLLARDWALGIASGTGWRGHGVTRPRYVLVVVSEGTHDFVERWTTQSPLWEQAQKGVFILDEPVNLVRGDDVDWLLKEYADEQPGLVVFDVIYGMGMADDNGVKDVLPVLASMKRISAAWQAATLALGHPGHNGGRRFRGSSSWRQLAAVEWHMADGALSCEKSKLTDRRRLQLAYAPGYPNLHWLSQEESMVRLGERMVHIQADIEAHPDDNIAERSRRLAPVFGVSERTARRYIDAYLAGSGE
jgi:hypothetical protein